MAVYWMQNMFLLSEVWKGGKRGMIYRIYLYFLEVTKTNEPECQINEVHV